MSMSNATLYICIYVCVPVGHNNLTAGCASKMLINTIQRDNDNNNISKIASVFLHSDSIESQPSAGIVTSYFRSDGPSHIRSDSKSEALTLQRVYDVNTT